MSTECSRIADQVRRAFSGKPWHGDPLRKILDGVTAEKAAARPVEGAHSIWELVRHVDVWMTAALDAAEGTPMPKIYKTPADWPVVEGTSEAAWSAATAKMFDKSERFAKAIEAFPGERLNEVVPGRSYDYTYYYLFHGIVQHSLYHGGQIALLAKAQ